MINRDQRLDYIKAIAITFVLIFHLHPIRISMKNSPSNLLIILNGFSKYIYTYFTLTAVPLFLIVSLYIFYKKINVSGNLSNKYFIKRLTRLTEIFIFWVICQFGIYYILKYFNYEVKSFYNFSFLQLINLGGPHLPLVKGSVFYFLFVLIVIISTFYLFVLLRRFKKFFITVSLIVVIGNFIYFEILNFNLKGLSYWRVDNFIIYIPLTYLLIFLEENKKLYKYIPLFFIGFIFFNVQDEIIKDLGGNTRAYSRMSVVFGSLSIFSSIIHLKNLKNNTFIRFLSHYSLGIFAVHKYSLLIVKIYSISTLFYIPKFISNSHFYVHSLTDSIFSVIITFIVVFVLSLTPIKRYIC